MILSNLIESAYEFGLSVYQTVKYIFGLLGNETFSIVNKIGSIYFSFTETIYYYREKTVYGDFY